MPVAAHADRYLLIVDNDPAVRASLQFSLEIEGFAVCVFDTGEAILAYEPFPPKACLIVDFSLPRMDGIELITALQDRGIDFPTIMMATDPSQHLRRRSLAAGLTLIEKPLLGDDLARAIRAALA